MKKRIDFALVMLLIGCILAGCGKGANNSAPTQPAATQATTELPAVEISDMSKLATVTVYSDNSMGSGFFIDDKGTLITCYHVIDGTTSITVETETGAMYAVETIVDFSEKYDIAVLSAKVEGNDYLKLCKNPVRQGETVYARGASKGLNGTFSNGIVSGVDVIIGGITCVQTNAATSGGNSGGPLMNVYGEVVGINAMGINSEDAQNMNFAVDVSMLDKLSMDKHWTLSDFQEWYTKELKRSYLVYDYNTGILDRSKIHTYHNVTGQSCVYSTIDWEYISTAGGSKKNGYHDDYGVFAYEYVESEFDQYTEEYLKQTLGFVFKGATEYRDWYYPGTMYIYYNEFTGVAVRLYVFENLDKIIVEACKV